MHSITQLTLGAAIGEATLGRSVGRKAAAWGAALGTLPDLDVLSSPFVDDYTQLVLHRGFSHSVFFALAGGAAIAYGLAKLHAKFGVSFGRWFLFTFLALFTHALLDGFTVYGTQLLNPVSNFPFAWNSIFIIDPLYTVPLLLGLVVALFLSRKSIWRQRFVMAGLTISSVYLGWGQIAKSMVDTDFEASLEEQGIEYQAFLSNPTALNSVLWMGMAQSEEFVYVALHGLMDPSDAKIRWMRIPRNQDLISNAIQSENPYVERLLWFSRGFYRLERDAEGRLFFHDLRFGRSDGYLTERGNYIFRFYLSEDETSGEITGFQQFRPVVEGRAATIDLLWKRLNGDTSIQGEVQQSLYPDHSAP